MTGSNWDQSGPKLTFKGRMESSHTGSPTSTSVSFLSLVSTDAYQMLPVLPSAVVGICEHLLQTGSDLLVSCRQTTSGLAGKTDSCTVRSCLLHPFLRFPTAHFAVLYIIFTSVGQRPCIER